MTTLLPPAETLAIGGMAVVALFAFWRAQLRPFIERRRAADA